MAVWSDSDLYALDAEFAETGVATHARSFHAAMRILQGEFVIGGRNDGQVDKVQRDWERLFPEHAENWPGKGIGLALSGDRVRKVIVPVIFGTAHIDFVRGLGFDSKEEFDKWCRNDSRIAWRAYLSFADLMDLHYGLDEVNAHSTQSKSYWALAHAQLESTVASLTSAFDLSAVTQSICMTVELSVKAGLLQSGLSIPEVTKFRHDLIAASDRLCELHPHRDDELLKHLTITLPPYVGSRYQSQNLTRLQIANLGLASQFVAASTVRRFSSRDLSLFIEKDLPANGRFQLFT